MRHPRWLGAFFLAASLSGHAAAARVPRLVVIIVVDQLRADYLPRFDVDLSSMGLRRLEREGVYFPRAQYDYGATKTGPGHALIGSGTYPSQNGIVGNQWFDRASSRTVACDELAPSLDGRTALRWFKGKSFAQRFHAVYPKGRIYGVSLKARSALLLGGPGQDDAFWWDDKEKHYRAFGPEPSWLKAARTSIPRPARNGEDVDASISAVALTLAESVHLGNNPSGAPDVLTVSLSELDYVGHSHGPDAPETRMAVVRVDQVLGLLMSRLQARVPRQDMLWVVTSDHGVTPIPEIARKKGLPAGRVYIPIAWRLQLGLVKAVAEPFVYVDAGAARRHGLTLDQAADQLRATALQWEGVQAIYTEKEILKGAASAVLRRSINPGRSGDLYMVLKPGYIFSLWGSGTTHGQPTPDDQCVPLIFLGAGLKPRIDSTAISPARIAPTLLKALNIPADDLLPPQGSR